jgi:dienelactone hydrolase
MSTPSLTKHTLPGTLGELLIDVRTGQRETVCPAVIVLHGFKGFKDWGMFPPLANTLARAGMTVVSFNLSGSGVDDAGDFTRLDQFARNSFRADMADLDIILTAMQTGTLGFVPPSSIGIVGHSRGGGDAVLIGADPRLTAMVTWAGIGTIRRWPEDALAQWRESGRIDIKNARTGQVLTINTDLLDEIEFAADDGLSIARAAARVGVPWLIIHGSGDTTIPLDEARRLHSASAPGTEFLLIDGAGHTFGAVHPYQGQTPQLEQAIEQTVGWFSRHLT